MQTKLKTKLEDTFRLSRLIARAHVFYLSNYKVSNWGVINFNSFSFKDYKIANNIDSFKQIKQLIKTLQGNLKIHQEKSSKLKSLAEKRGAQRARRV